jgi:hypothetical protein
METTDKEEIMNGAIRIHYGYKVELYHCENRECGYAKIDDAYSWEHVNVLGWRLKRADMFGEEKASGINKNLRSKDGTLCELYCPSCAKDLRS